jgi:hypothetical protein
MRQRAMAAGAAFSGSVAAFCLGSWLTAGAPGPLWGLLAGAVAAIALVRGALRDPANEAVLRLCPRRGVVLGEDGNGEMGAETEFRPIGVTRSLICLASTRGRSQWRSIWRDSLAPEAFRRIAAYALWRRSAMPDPVHGSELIARKTVTGGQSAPRTGKPRGQ